MTRTLVRAAASAALALACACTDEQTCDDTIAEHRARTSAIVEAHAGACVDAGDCAFFTAEVRCDDAERAAFDDDRVALSACPAAVHADDLDAARADLLAFRDELCARPLAACTNGDFDCAGELACVDGACALAF